MERKDEHAHIIAHTSHIHRTATKYTPTITLTDIALGGNPVFLEVLSKYSRITMTQISPHTDTQCRIKTIAKENFNNVHKLVKCKCPKLLLFSEPVS